MIELLIVLTVITILLGISLFYISGHSALYKPDEQALKIIDVFQEARQRSLTQRETMRVEIDLTTNLVRLIDENQVTTATDDFVIRSVVLQPQSEINMSSQPPDISTFPADSMPIPIAQFRPSVYPTSASNNVCTFRFLRNGSVVNEGTDAIGSNATTAGATLFIWSPKKDVAGESEIARAITVIGATGSVRFWEYNRALSDSNKWKDSRRMSIYGGAGGSNSNAIP